MEKKTRKEFIDHGCGFPVILRNVSMVRIRGIWTPNINYQLMHKIVLTALVHKPARLTGAEIRFIRHHFEMTTQSFAKRFSVTHPAVLKWEKCGKHSSTMSWATEKDLRLFVMLHLTRKARDILVLYQELEEQKTLKTVPVTIDARYALAA